MPLPRPRDDESHDDWIDRCMSNEVMKDEYPDNDQRLAVCSSLWEKKSVRQDDEEDEWIEIRVRTPDDFVSTSYRTIDISKEQGIRATIGKLKSDPDGSTQVQRYLFLREKWTEPEAKAWVKEHKDSLIIEIEKRASNNVNRKGVSHARNLVQAGKVDKNAPWSFDAEDGSRLLGDPPDWAEYGKWFLAVDTGQDPETKAHYKYPHGKGGKVYRGAVIAAKQRAAAQGEDDISNAADGVLQMIDKEKEEDEAKTNIERRFYPFSELRVDGEKEPKLVGYAAIFDSLSEEMWGFKEKVAKGAFEKSLQRDDIRMLWNHDPNFVLARNKSGTLQLKEDTKGLYFEATPPDTQWAKDLLVSIKRGDITQNSFGFIILDDEWDEDDEGRRVRSLKKVKLFDVSPVTYPAYPQTELHIRGKWGETTLVYESMKEGTRKTIANIVRANEKAKVKQTAHRYGITESIYSSTEPNPTVFLTNSTSEADGEDKAKTSFVEPKQKAQPNPRIWAKVSKYLST